MEFSFAYRAPKTMQLHKKFSIMVTSLAPVLLLITSQRDFLWYSQLMIAQQIKDTVPTWPFQGNIAILLVL